MEDGGRRMEEQMVNGDTLELSSTISHTTLTMFFLIPARGSF
jgi:hypothetical protein